MNALRKLSAATFGAAFVALGIGPAALADLPLDTAPLPVKPVVDGVVACPGGPYVAYFGYQNQNTDTVNIPVGQYNRYSSVPENRGQVTTFLPGRAYRAFTVKFDGNPLVWILGTPQGGARTATAAATTNTKTVAVCPI